MDIYKKAAKCKLTFITAKGQLPVADLFDLPLTTTSTVITSLDDIAQNINRSLKTHEEESFVKAPSKGITKLRLQMAIIKDVIAEVQKDNQAAEDRVTNRAKHERIKEILAEKEDGALSDMSKEELRDLLKETEEKVEA